MPWNVWLEGGGEQNKLNNVHDKYMANKMNKLLNISDISLLWYL